MLTSRSRPFTWTNRGQVESVSSRATRWSVAVVFGTSVAAWALAMIGQLRPWLTVPLAALVSWGVGRQLPRSAERWSPAVVTGLAAVVLSVVTLGLVAPHQHFLTSRDSGTYMATATWISRTGGLEMDAHDPVFDGEPSLVYESLGFPADPNDAGRLMPQFLHVFPALLAFVGQIFGTQAIYWVNPLLTGVGLAVFASVARRVVGQGMALAAAFILASSMPFLYFSRAPFTESLMFFFVFAGLWVLDGALASGSSRQATAAGLLFGGAMLTRIDGVVVLLGLVAYATILDLGSPETMGLGRESQRRVMERVVVVAGALWALSLVDMLMYARQYLGDHGPMIVAVMGAVLALRVLGQVVHRRSGALVSARVPLGNAVTALLGAFIAYAWLIRPYVEKPIKSDIYGITGLQEAAGVAVEPLRSYAELSVRWLSWYLGPVVVAAGLLGLLLLVRRLLSVRIHDWGPLISVTLVTTALYVYRPSINPDHIWAMRRFIPVVIPALIVTGVWMLNRLGGVVNAPRWLAAVVVIALSIPPLMVSGQAGLQPEFAGAGDDVAEMCREIDGSAVLFVGESAATYQTVLQPVVRGWCGVPAATEHPDTPLEPAAIEALAESARDSGKTLVVVGAESEAGEEFTLFDEGYEYLELTLFGPPDSTARLDLRIEARRWR